MLERLNGYRRLLWAILIVDAVIFLAISGMLLLTGRLALPASGTDALDPSAFATGQSDIRPGVGPTVRAVGAPRRRLPGTALVPQAQATFLLE